METIEYTDRKAFLRAIKGKRERAPRRRRGEGTMGREGDLNELAGQGWTLYSYDAATDQHTLSGRVGAFSAGDYDILLDMACGGGAGET